MAFCVGTLRAVSDRNAARSGEARNIDALPVCEFAGPGPLRDKIIASVFAGEKTATSSLLGQYVDEELPAAGQQFAVVDSEERRIAVIEVTEVKTVRLGDVDEAFALAEGEGFRSLAEWRTAHEDFWLADPEIAGLGIAVNDQTFVVTQRFALIERLSA